MATRFYLPAGTGFGTGPVTPAFTGWQESGAADRRFMFPAKQAGDTKTQKNCGTTTPGNTALYRQYISEPLKAGNVFTSGSTTFGSQVQGFESAINDNIINRVRRVAVYDVTGNTLQATLIALGNATSVVEWNTAGRNLTYLNATAAGASYTTVDGDRLIYELGHDDSAGASITGALILGADSSLGTDLPVDETDVTTTKLPWFETSVNLVFYAHDDLVMAPPIGTWRTSL